MKQCRNHTLDNKKEKNVNCDSDFVKKFGNIHENWKCDTITQILSIPSRVSLTYIYKEAIAQMITMALFANNGKMGIR